MFQCPLRLLPILALILLAPIQAPAQESTTAATAEAELRQAIQLYDDALRRADVAAVERFWATEYVFVNPRGEHVSRDERGANLREKRTVLASVAHALQEEMIRTYMDGNMAVYTTLLTIDGRYGGRGRARQVSRPGSLDPPGRPLATGRQPDDTDSLADSLDTRIDEK